jgi:hypothetical protein
MAGAPPYRLALNWDGAPHGYSVVPQSMDAFLQKVFAPTVGTAVDALFWCAPARRLATRPCTAERFEWKSVDLRPTDPHAARISASELHEYSR